VVNAAALTGFDGRRVISDGLIVTAIAVPGQDVGYL
jgi:hypothetical protein